MNQLKGKKKAHNNFRAAIPYHHLLLEVQEVQQDQANQQDPEYHLYQQGLEVLFLPEEIKPKD